MRGELEKAAKKPKKLGIINGNYNGTPDDSTSNREVKRSSIVIRGNN